ncbi:MAG: F0F1 ATP synthase subunit epsilon [Chloroflexaceae bacterium]
MRVKIITPTAIPVDKAVSKITAEATNGSFSLLPRHIDFVAALVPGILALTDDTGDEQFLAIDEGLLVKRGDEVRISVSRAVRGPTLEELQQVVEAEFQQRDEQERMARTAISRLEAGFIRRMLEERGQA